MTGQHEVQAAGVWLERRFLPFPASLSPVSLAGYAAMVDQDGNWLDPEPGFPATDEHTVWMQWRSRSNASMARLWAARIDPETPRARRINVNGVNVDVATPPGQTAGEWPGKVLLAIHGGALVAGNGEFSRLEASVHAQEQALTCYSVDYRMAPEHPYPASLDDCVSVYRALLAEYGADSIVVAGASAGGNLAAAMVLRARDEGLPTPAALLLHSPEVDLTESGDSFQVNRGVDPVLQPLMRVNLMYAGVHDLADPYLSPLFGDLTGFPPTFISSGTRDLFLSNAVRMHRALRRAKVSAELHLWEGIGHGAPAGSREEQELVEETRRFIRSQLEEGSAAG